MLAQPATTLPGPPTQSCLEEPFFLALAPAPYGEAVATVVINGGGVGRLSVRRTEAGKDEEFFSFASLKPVLLRWNWDGSALAFAHGSLWLLRQRSGPVAVARLPEAVRWIGFDASSRSFCVAGQSLFTASADDFEPLLMHTNIRAADTGRSGIVAIVEGERDLQVEWPGRARATTPWPLGPSARPCIRAARDSSTVFLSAETAQQRGRARLQIAAFDDRNGVTRLVDEEVGVGIAAPRPQWEPWLDASVLALFEAGQSASLWECAPEREPRRISPAGFEVFTFSACPSARKVAFVASHCGNAESACDRRLYVATQIRSDWHVKEMAEGPTDLVAWSAEGDRLLYVRAEPGEWRWQLREARRSETASVRPPSRAVRVQALEVCGESAELIELTTSSPQPTGVLCLQGPHRQFVSGPQPLFFHHALFCLLRVLARHGHAVAALNPPGTVGRGRHRREVAGRSYGEAAVEALAAGTDFLHKRGCNTLVIVAGSLAVVPALRFLAGRAEIAAAALISPVYSPDVPALAEWSWLFGDARPTAAELAPQIHTPVITVEGLEDEILSRTASEDVFTRLGSAASSRRILLENEGHIYRRYDSWLRVVESVETFLDESGLSGHPAETR